MATIHRVQLVTTTLLQVVVINHSRIALKNRVQPASTTTIVAINQNSLVNTRSSIQPVATTTIINTATLNDRQYAITVHLRQGTTISQLLVAKPPTDTVHRCHGTLLPPDASTFFGTTSSSTPASVTIFATGSSFHQASSDPSTASYT